MKKIKYLIGLMKYGCRQYKKRDFNEVKCTVKYLILCLFSKRYWVS